MEQIWGYAALVDCIESLRKTPFDSSNSNHEEKLLSLWATLVPEEALEARVTKQWQHIGFQGTITFVLFVHLSLYCCVIYVELDS